MTRQEDHFGPMVWDALTQPRPSCSVDDCQKKAKARGLCQTHYSRWRRTGKIGTAELIAQRDRVCSVNECGRKAEGRGLCLMHRKRWVKTGKTGPVDRIYEPGQLCSLDDCQAPISGRGYCEKHYRRWRAHGDPSADRVPSARKGAGHYNWRGAEISYRTAHRRVADAKGPAAAHECSRCTATASEWAYDHADPGEMFSPTGSAYSADTDHYMPMCVSCHRSFDNERKNR